MKRRSRGGYVDVWAPDHPLARKDGYVAEHRMVAYDAGLPVDAATHVHHENHDKADNRIENLVVATPIDHALLHAEEGTIYNQYGAWPTGQGFRRRHAAKVAELGERHCEMCGTDISALRVDATVCGNACRIKRWEARNR